MITFGIILLVLGFAQLIMGAVIEARGKHKGWCTGLGWHAGVFAVLGVMILSEVNTMTPMDVYQGKTTLEYTIGDGEVIDSVVVWKVMEEKK